MALNHEYDRNLVVGQIHAQRAEVLAIAEHLGTVALSLDDVTGRIVGPEQHAWHTDHASDSLERTARQLEAIADSLRRIGEHTMYPPTKH